MQAVGKEISTVVTTCINSGNEIPQDICKDITYDLLRANYIIAKYDHCKIYVKEINTKKAFRRFQYSDFKCQRKMF